MMTINATIADEKFRKYLPQIVRILEESLNNKKVKVYLFGSRARNEAHHASDFDLAVESCDLKRIELINLKEAFYESTIPYKVDMVDLNRINGGLKTEIQREGALIWEN
jgi:predicted nucleotidyltransferase